MKEAFELTLTSKNRLYNFIQTKRDSISKVLNFSSHTHSSGNSEYFYFELPLTEHIFLEPYTLVGHHLSVYAKPMGFLDANSEYHYTAYVKDVAGEYRLHVYFDTENNIVWKPLFAKIMPENELHLSCLEHETTFAFLARSSIQSLIIFLRKEQHQFNLLREETVKTKHIEYLALKEKAALISDLNSLQDKKTWIAVIADAIQKIEDLSQLTEISRELLGEKKFLQDLQKDMAELIAEQEANKRVEPCNPRKAKNQLSYATINASLSSQINRQVPQKPLLSVQLSKLKTQYSKVLQLEKNKQEPKIVMENLHSLYRKLIEIELDLQSYKTCLKDIDEMKKLRDPLIEKGTKYLQNLLIQGKFNEGELLHLFYQHLSPEIMTQLALLTNNSSLLDFLLKNKIISIQYNNFTIHTIGYSSMIDYCFKKTNDKVSMLSCLKVLIQHEGSLLEIDSANNLPFAANLLLNPGHSLGLAIELYEDRHTSFYKQLNRVLRVLLRQAKDETRKEEISNLIQDNELKIGARICNSLLGELQIETKDNYNSIQQIKESFVENLLAKVLSDPQVKVMNLLVQNRLNQYLKNLPFLQRLSIKHHTKDFIHQFQNSISSIMIDTNIDFETCKKDILEMFMKELSLLNLSEEINKINSFLQQNPYLKKSNSQVKEALRRKDEFIQKLNELKDYFSLNLHSDLPSIIKKMLENPSDYSIDMITNEHGDLELVSNIDINVEELEIRLEDGLIHIGKDGDGFSLGIKEISAKDKVVLGKNKITIKMENKLKALDQNDKSNEMKSDRMKIGPGEQLEILSIPSSNGKKNKVVCKRKINESEKQFKSSVSALNASTSTFTKLANESALGEDNKKDLASMDSKCGKQNC